MKDIKELRNELVKYSSPIDYEGMPPVPEKVNPSIPDTVWHRLQNMGVVATAHLERLITSPKFANLSVKDQLRIIEVIMLRTYGSPDSGVRRNLNMQVNLEDGKGYNALTDLATKARDLPEFGGNVSTLAGRRHHTRRFKE